MFPLRHLFVFVVQFPNKTPSGVRLCTAVVVLYVKYRGGGGGGQHRIKEHRRDPSQAVFVPSTEPRFHLRTHIKQGVRDIPVFDGAVTYILVYVVVVVTAAIVNPPFSSSLSVAVITLLLPRVLPSNGRRRKEFLAAVMCALCLPAHDEANTCISPQYRSI